MPDRYQPLRDAIAAGPTKGKWRADTEGKPDSDMNHGVIAEINDLWIAAMYRSGTTTDGGGKTPEAEAEAAANAHYIAEANPDTIAALLVDYDRLQRELEFIAYANPSRWDADMRDQFQEWAQNRARAALADGEEKQ